MAENRRVLYIGLNMAGADSSWVRELGLKAVSLMAEGNLRRTLTMKLRTDLGRQNLLQGLQEDVRTADRTATEMQSAAAGQRNGAEGIVTLALSGNGML